MNEYKVTWKLYRSWATENMAKGSRLAMMIVWCVFALACLVLGIVFWPEFRLFYLVMALFGIYRAFLRNFVVSKAQYRRLAQAYGTQDWVRRITFEEDGISLTEGNFSYKYAYADIKEVREKGNKIWLFAANKTVLRLYRDAFVEGTDWGECKARLDEMVQDSQN